MNFSELTLHEDYNLKAINDMFRAGKKRLIRFNNIKLGDVTKHESPPKIIKEKKKEIAQHKKPNNNPRLNLIKKTQQLIRNYKEQKYASSELDSRSDKNKIKIRYISTSFSNRKTPIPPRFHQSSEQYRYPKNSHIFAQQFLGNSLGNNQPRNNLGEDPEGDSVHISKHFQRRKMPNKSTIDEIAKKVEEEKRPNTTRRRNRPSFENIEPW